MACLPTLPALPQIGHRMAQCAHSFRKFRFRYRGVGAEIDNCNHQRYFSRSPIFSNASDADALIIRYVAFHAITTLDPFVSLYHR